MYKQLQELVNLKSETIHLSGDTKVFKETTIIFSSKLVEQEKHISWLATSFEEPGEKWVSAIDLSSKFTHPKCKLKQTLQKYLQTSKLKISKTWLLLKWNYPILHQAKLLLFIRQTLTNWNGHFSKHLKIPHMYHRSQNNWHPWS